MTPRPASTVVLVRECGQQIETLLLLRNSKLVFEGGTWVFPGGKIEQSDYPRGSTDEYEAARHAAVRETHEESGIRLSPESLIHIAHWTTPLGPPRRYATWFFLCPLTEPVIIQVDDDEILDHQWLTPADALRRFEAGEIRLPVPTRETLVSLLPHTRLERLCQVMQEADIHVFPPDSQHYVPRPVG